MYTAVEAGLVQRICGDFGAALPGEGRSGEQTVVGVNKYRVPEVAECKRDALKPPPKRKIEAQLKRLKRFKAARGRDSVARALTELGRAAASRDANVFEAVVDGACAGLTHGEICAKLREVYGFGNPLIVA